MPDRGDHDAAISAFTLAGIRRHGLRVVEDAAHALPTTFDGKPVGSLASDIAVFSFYANKAVSTGEGGMLVTRSPEIAHRARVMRLHGIDRDAFDRFVATEPQWHYEIVAPGFKYNMSDVAAALGIHQLKLANTFQERRAAIAAQYDAALAELGMVLPPHARAGDVHSWHLYAIRLGDRARVERKEFITRMSALGIGCSVHCMPLHLHPYWRDRYRLTPEMFPASQAVFERTVSLPMYTRMTDEDVARVVSAVRAALG